MKHRKLHLILAVCCVFVFAVLLLVSRHLSGLLPGQQAAERWQNQSEAAQISVFFRQDQNFTTDQIQSLHETIDSELTSKSLKAENKNSRLWYDAYSTQAGQTEVSGTRKNSSHALVTVVGGDFFLMHMPELVSGSYFSQEDLMHDRVVIDTQLAWQLFGSSDAAGMEITVQGEKCLIAGVIRPETDYASRTAYGTVPRIYLPYAFYLENWGLEQGAITCYEAVLPNPVRKFAENLLTKSMNLENADTVILQNTGRYALSGQWNTLRHLRNLVVCETVTYPYWENAARIVSFDMARLLLAEILLLIYPVLFLIYLLCRGYVLAGKKIDQKKLAWKNRYRSQIHQI